MNRLLLLTRAAVTCLTGCAYSQKNFKEIGQLADQGQYGAVAFRSTFGVFISAVVDVVSLGGALSPDEAEDTWSTAASEAAAARSTDSANNSYPSTPPSQVIGTTEASQTASAATSLPSAPSPTPEPQSPQDTNNTASSSPSYQFADNCVSRDTSSNPLGDFWENHCSFPVFVSWIDGHECRNSCGAGPIQPGDKESTTKAEGSFSYAACEYPGHARTADGAQWRGGDYKCK